jgi:hypothetical protein
MTNTALKLRAVREKRRKDPEIREKVATVLDRCDEALEDASELVAAAAAILSKYPLIDDVTYHCNVQDIQRISDSLAQIVECRKKLDKDRYISKLATGRLGAEIDHLGEAFLP